MIPRRRAEVVLAVVALGLAACSKRDEPAPAPCVCASAASEIVVSPQLLAFLSKARSAHHEADIAEDAGSPERAIAVLEKMISERSPGPFPEVVEVTADTRARLAELESGLGRFDSAERHIDQGLALATTPTHFRGHLFEVRGVVLQQRAKLEASRGNDAAADELRAKALAAFDAAMAIQTDVIDRSLGDAGKR